VERVGAAAVSSRLQVAFAACLVLAALTLVARDANGSTAVWDRYLAPSGVCAGENDRAAPLAQQAQAIGCLVNWARAEERRSQLRERSALRRAARLKGRVVASCRQFSHTPCGTDVAAAVRESGYRYVLLGENLFAGPWGRVSPREVVSAWLRSPPHRANLLGARFRDLGVAPARAPDLFGGGRDAVVWTAAFAVPR
jgi:uncharacterized protein YkwD